MKKSEIPQLLAVIAAAYPRFPEITEAMVSIWFEMFKDTDYLIANIALKKLILENTFPPSVAELRKAIVDISTPEELKIDFATAWGEVTKAVANFGYMRGNDAVSSMSPRTARVVEMIGWQNICETEELSVLRGQFRMMYETTEAREKQDALIPAALREQIALITQKSNFLIGKSQIAIGKEE